jgi:polysaccharide export outer membrane protein
MGSAMSMPLSVFRCLMMFVAMIVGLHTSPAFAQAAPPSKSDYVIGAGDVLKVTVYQSPDLSIETRVSETGIISFPLLGQVKLGGMSVAQAEKTLADGLLRGNFLKSPQVTILVTQVRGNQVSVLGYVNKPGRYPLESSGMRLSDLLALAGGIAPNGSDFVTVSGNRNSKPIRVEVDVTTLFSPGGSAKDIVVQDGDTLFVDRMPQIYIYGEVQKPGAVRLERGMTVMQALAAGGGVTARGTERGLRINRTGADGKVQEIHPSMNDMMQNGDVLYIRQSLF